MHTCPALHGTLQPPQWSGSLFVSVHLPSQKAKPALHWIPHCQPTHTGDPFGSVGHCLPQRPQLATSELVSRH